MAENPYASPSPIQDQPSTTGKLLLRFVAAFCWLLALFVIAGAVFNLGRPENMFRREFHPVLFWLTMLEAFVLPTAILVLLGFAGWRRSRRPALLALAPFALMILIPLGIKAAGIYRRLYNIPPPPIPKRTMPQDNPPPQARWPTTVVREAYNT